MKLIVAVLHDRDQKRASEALLRAGHKFTKIASTGGFLREGNVTLLIGAARPLLCGGEIQFQAAL